MDVRSFSLERLLSLSVQHGLITDYRIAPHTVSLLRDEELVLECDPEEARIFLQGLLAGHYMTTGPRPGLRGGPPPDSGKASLA